MKKKTLGRIGVTHFIPRYKIKSLYMVYMVLSFLIRMLLFVRIRLLDFFDQKRNETSSPHFLFIPVKLYLLHMHWDSLFYVHGWKLLVFPLLSFLFRILAYTHRTDKIFEFRKNFPIEKFIIVMLTWSFRWNLL